MSREPDNPFLAPAMMARPQATAGAQPVWLMWMVGTFVAETALTLTTIFLDSRDVLNDSGQVTFAANGVLWFFLTVAVALRFPFAIACGLTVVLGVIGWITMIMVAFFAVPAMLNGSIGHPVYGYAAMSCLGGDRWWCRLSCFPFRSCFRGRWPRGETMPAMSCLNTPRLCNADLPGGPNPTERGMSQQSPTDRRLR